MRRKSQEKDDDDTSSDSRPSTPERSMHILFGRPGSGKSTVAEMVSRTAAEQHGGTPPEIDWLDLDCLITPQMRENFSKGVYPTPSERLRFADSACEYVNSEFFGESGGATLPSRYRLISFSFVNENLRSVFRHHFPHARWILIDTPADVSAERTRTRDGHFYEASGKEERGEEWQFAPVMFDHDRLDGTEDVEDTVAAVWRILKV